MTKRRVVVTGIGAVTSAGSGGEFWNNILSGSSYITKNTLFEPSEGEATTAAIVDLKKAIEITKRVPNKREVRKRLSQLTDEEGEKIDNRTLYFTLSAAQLAVEDAKLELDENGLTKNEKERTGAIIGNIFGDSKSIWEVRPSAGHIALNLSHGPPVMLTVAYDFHGPSYSVSSACASGSIAIINATREIQVGGADIMLAGGTSAHLTPDSVWKTFNQIGILSDYNGDPSKAYKALDQMRRGIVFGEGAGILVLEGLEHAKRRKAEIYAEITNYSSGLFCTSGLLDVSHIGYVDVLSRMLKEADINPQTIDETTYLNLHGTGTIKGDPIEISAVIEALGESNLGKNIFGSSTKPSYGHNQETASALGVIICAQALKDGKMPPTANLENPIHPGDFLLKNAKEGDVKLAISIAAGFGGYHTAILLRKFNQ